MRRSLILIVFPVTGFRAAILCGALVLSVLPRAFSQSSSSEGIPGVSVPASQNPFLGSNPEEKVSPEVLQIDYKDAIDRGLRTQSGGAPGWRSDRDGSGRALERTGEMLPDVRRGCRRTSKTSVSRPWGSTNFSLCSHRRALQAFPAVIPAFNYFDARASLSQSIFSFKNLERERAASRKA